MINITIDTRQLMRLQRSVAAVKKSLPRELAAVINKVAKRTEKSISVEIRKELTVSAGSLKNKIKNRRKASVASLSAVVGLNHENRLGLQYFKARQTKTGVSYKISKTGGRKSVAGAFMGPEPGTLAPRLYGGVFARVGVERLPIVKLRGVSPYGVYAKNDLKKEEVERIQKDLQTEMERRIQFNIARAGGLNR